MKTIVIDTLGGDNGAKPIIEAAKKFLNENKDYKLILTGDKNELSSLEGVCEIIDAPEVVPMTAGALEVMRMKNSSMYQAIEYLKNNHADAVVSCGSTGGFLSAATIGLKNLPGVKRAALVSAFPTKIKGKKVVILDIGASNENSPEELEQFAVMGSLYAKSVFKYDKPRVYLLANGSEDTKGSPTSKEAFKLLKNNKKVNFIGNMEARDALNGEAEVIVSDGFSGNIFLKGAEGVAKMMAKMVKAAFKKNLWSKLGYLHVRKGIKEMSDTMDYKSVGGGMLVGVNGVVVKAHGNSDAYSFECAMNVAKNLVDSKVVEKIEKGLN